MSLKYAMAKAMDASAYRDCGQYDKADIYLKDALLKVSLEYGEEHPCTATILNTQGLLYKK